MDKRLQAEYLLAAARNFNARHYRMIDEGLGGIEALLSADEPQILELPLAASMAQRLLSARAGLKAHDELKKLAARGVELVGFGSEHYPELLKETEDAPVALFCKGDISMMLHHGVAIVGSRKCSSGGREIASGLARDLAELGVPVVSGMALGIDGAAHEGALAAGGPTVAVLGCGIDVVYPPAHHELYAELCDKALVISEYPPGTSPDKPHFPRRNRIISGLSRGVVVVEGSVSSGALITAKVAVEQGREVFAVPGPVRSPYARGPHHLIKNGNAKLVEGIDDILVEFGTTRAELIKQRSADKPATGNGNLQSGSGSSADPVSPTQPETRVLEHVSYEGTHINELVRKLGLTTPECVAHLTMLEIKGLISTAGGGFYIRQ